LIPAGEPYHDGTMKIRCYLKPSCGWSNGVRAIMKKYALAYEDVDIINVPANYAEMVARTGQRLSPCVEQYLLAQGLVQPNDVAPAAPTDAPCTDAEHEKMKVKTIRFY
jgi:monothiol glutaredoxin